MVVFFNGQNIDIDIRAKILAGGSNDIISQYVTFSKVATDMIKKYGKTSEAIKETLRICKDKSILVEYLKEREAEVMSIMEALFDQEEVTRRYGIALEKAKAEEIAKNMIDDNVPVDSIAKYTGLSPEQIVELASFQTV